jgi:hypothetical protein
VEQVLADPARARAVALEGRRAVLAGHTYADRARVLLGEEVFAERPPAPPAAVAGAWRR